MDSAVRVASESAKRRPAASEQRLRCRTLLAGAVSLKQRVLLALVSEAGKSGRISAAVWTQRPPENPRRHYY